MKRITTIAQAWVIMGIWSRWTPGRPITQKVGQGLGSAARVSAIDPRHHEHVWQVVEIYAEAEARQSGVPLKILRGAMRTMGAGKTPMQYADNVMRIVQAVVADPNTRGWGL